MSTGGLRGRRMEQRDEQLLHDALWVRLETQLVRRKEQCASSLSSSKRKINIDIETNDEKNSNSSETLGLLTAIRRYRDTNGFYNDDSMMMECHLPSSCPRSVTETKVALVLVVNGNGDGTMHTHPDWRQVLVACFKILPVVDELWILISEKVWNALSQDNNSSDDSSSRLYRERFRQWYRHSEATRARPMIVPDRNGAWMEALGKLNKETTATSIVWAEWKHTTREASWKNFVDMRLEQWRKMPTLLYVPYRWRLLHKNHRGDSRHVVTPIANSDPSCPLAAITSGAEGGELPVSMQLVAGNTSHFSRIVALPSMHGAIHDRAWLCYWAHPIVQRFMQQSDWAVVSLSAALWMAHLTGTRDIAVDELGLNGAIQTHPSIMEVFNFFGGASLPTTNLSVVQPCETR